MAELTAVFDAVLIANRGEIACRIIRTLKRLGIHAVAVYSDADRDARHVAQGDHAIRIGPPPASDSYLCADAILDAAARGGAQAIHPGYGFLAENAGFAKACGDAGLTFVGPTAAAIEIMGAKDRAKAAAAAADVPLVPGYHGGRRDQASLLEAAHELGFPVLLKAVAGGGGKGMRVVPRPDDFAAALEGARREAQAAFGDDDSPEQHAADVWKSSHESANMELVEVLTGDARSAIHWLEELGVEFTRQNGGYRLARCGGASAKRLLQVGDRTGHAITKALRDAFESGAGTVFPNSPLQALEPAESGWRARAGEHELEAATVVLAAGGRCFRVAKERGEL